MRVLFFTLLERLGEELGISHLRGVATCKWKLAFISMSRLKAVIREYYRKEINLSRGWNPGLVVVGLCISMIYTQLNIKPVDTELPQFFLCFNPYSLDFIDSWNCELICWVNLKTNSVLDNSFEKNKDTSFR